MSRIIKDGFHNMEIKVLDNGHSPVSDGHSGLNTCAIKQCFVLVLI
jgi:hypothetical protein